MDVMNARRDNPSSWSVTFSENGRAGSVDEGHADEGRLAVVEHLVRRLERQTRGDRDRERARPVRPEVTALLQRYGIATAPTIAVSDLDGAPLAKEQPTMLPDAFTLRELSYAEAAEHTTLQKVVPFERQGRVFGFAQSVEQAATPVTAIR